MLLVAQRRIHLYTPAFDRGLACLQSFPDASRSLCDGVTQSIRFGPMRVLLLNNIPAPYFLPIFRQLRS
jgi:hypothetical protein